MVRVHSSSVEHESRKLIDPEWAQPPYHLELPAMEHCFKSLRPCLLERIFQLQTDKASLRSVPSARTSGGASYDDGTPELFHL
jgi:hypothetical protein